MSPNDITELKRFCVSQAHMILNSNRPNYTQQMSSFNTKVNIPTQIKVEEVLTEAEKIYKFIIEKQ